LLRRQDARRLRRRGQLGMLRRIAGGRQGIVHGRGHDAGMDHQNMPTTEAKQAPQGQNFIDRGFGQRQAPS
jgi:hypothetical protein